MQKALNPKPENDYVKRGREIEELLRQKQEEDQRLRATMAEDEYSLLLIQTYRDVLLEFYPKEEVDKLIKITPESVTMSEGKKFCANDILLDQLEELKRLNKNLEQFMQAQQSRKGKT